MEVGLKLPVAPVGRPVRLKPTAPENPFAGVTVAVYVVALPTTTVCEAGVTASVKSGEDVVAKICTSFTSQYQDQSNVEERTMPTIRTPSTLLSAAPV
jgi:hypothetical protein